MTEPKEPCCSTRVAVLEAELASMRREVALAHKAHEDLHVEAAKVLDKDAELMRERLGHMNFERDNSRKEREQDREAAAQAQATYLRQEVYNAQHEPLVQRVGALEKNTVGNDVVSQLGARLSAAETLAATAAAKLVGQATGVTQTQAGIGAVAVVITIIIAIATIVGTR